MKRRGLGRGLEALIPSAASGTLEVAVERLRPGSHQPRRRFDPQDLADLTNSVRAHGVIQPLVVEPDGDGYLIVAGERRWRAAQAAGLATVPAVLRGSPGSTTLELSLVENLQRADLDPIEEAEAIQELIRLQSLTQEEAARRVGRSREAVTNSLRLLELPAPVRAAIAERRLSAGHGKVLAGVTDPALAARIAETVERGQMSVRQTEQLARRSSGPGRRTRSTAVDPDLRALERRIAEILGLPVTLTSSTAGGSLTIRFSAGEQLDHLLTLLERGSGS
ncbi:MAG: ParB/RepB/Spo0J family partition protein [Candidatus Dormibacteria bacterium]